MTNITEFKTWRVDVIEKILNASMVGEYIELDDHISIDIKIDKDTTYQS